jgi:beta-N-acetylhexosaminidase
VAATHSPEAARALYRTQGAALTALGFHLNLAPVVEPLTPDNRLALGDRSFGPLPDALRYGDAALRGLRDGGLEGAPKHFPGSTNVDPHTGLPELAADADALSSIYTAPFRPLLTGEDGAAAVLLAHTRTALDPGVPACLSAAWITGVLRGDWGFTGLVITDDLFMAALTANGYPPDQAVVQAIEAGADLVMLSEKRIARPVAQVAAKAAADPRFAEKTLEAAARVLCFKMYCGLIE